MFNKNVIDIHFQKMKKIYFELGMDPSLKQAFILSLQTMIENHTMIIMEEKFKSITILQIGFIRQEIFQALDSICIKRTILKQIVKNNPTLD